MIIKIEYKNENKIIEMNGNRKAFTNPELDYTCIEILDEDHITQFFETDDNIKDINLYKDQEVFMLQYPLGNESSFSSGKIISIDYNTIKHTCATKKGSSGSPIAIKQAMIPLSKYPKYPPLLLIIHP